MKLYNIDYNRFIVLMLPVRLRKQILIALIKAMLSPVMLLHGMFVTFRNNVLKSLQINGQVCYLQGILNDTFDISQRRIYISDANALQRMYIYTRAENKPIYLNMRVENKPIYLNTRADFADAGFDFYVNLNGVRLTVQQLTQMRVILDRYKLATKIYNIR